MMTFMGFLICLVLIIVVVIVSVFLYRYIELKYNQWEDEKREAHRDMLRKKYPNRY